MFREIGRDGLNQTISKMDFHHLIIVPQLETSAVTFSFDLLYFFEQLLLPIDGLFVK